MATEPQFHVGDICRIKDLETIKSECMQIDGDGDIVCQGSDGTYFYFWKSDFDTCGAQVTIKDVRAYGNMYVYHAEEFHNINDYRGFNNSWIVDTILEPCQPTIDSANLAERFSNLFAEVI